MSGSEGWLVRNDSVLKCVLCPPLTAGLTSLADESSCSRGWQHLSLQILATEWLSNTALSPVSQDNPIFVEEGRFRWWSETSSQGNFFYLVKDKREICLGLNLLVYLTERIFWEFYPERKNKYLENNVEIMNNTNPGDWASLWLRKYNYLFILNIIVIPLCHLTSTYNSVCLPPWLQVNDEVVHHYLFTTFLATRLWHFLLVKIIGEQFGPKNPIQFQMILLNIL